MDERTLLAMAYLVPGAMIALLALHAGAALSATYRELAAGAAEAGRDMPTPVTLYFKHVSRVLSATALLFLAVICGDALVSHLAHDRLLLRVLGYGGGVVLLVCCFALLLHGTADRQLRLRPRGWRWAYIFGGAAGIGVAGYGMALVTWHDTVWPGA